VISISAKCTWESETSAVVMAHSSNCRYHILIDEDTVKVTSHGLEILLDREEDLPPYENFEALAIAAILHLEAN
jgi:hypothetical protein